MKLFQRRQEDFKCENCGHQAKGSGYTNHCPKCLFSKHVDVNPGDRSESCRGLMQPMNILVDHGEYIIIHKCIKCGLTKKNKTAEKDDFNLIIKLSTRAHSSVGRAADS